jgi:hypothetical protein
VKTRAAVAAARLVAAATVGLTIATAVVTSDNAPSAASPKPGATHYAGISRVETAAHTNTGTAKRVTPEPMPTVPLSTCSQGAVEIRQVASHPAANHRKPAHRASRPRRASSHPTRRVHPEPRRASAPKHAKKHSTSTVRQAAPASATRGAPASTLYVLTDVSAHSCSIDQDNPPLWLAARVEKQLSGPIGATPAATGPAVRSIAPGTKTLLEVRYTPVTPLVPPEFPFAQPLRSEVVPSLSILGGTTPARAPAATRPAPKHAAHVARPHRPAPVEKPTRYKRNSRGYDISWPQCPGPAYPRRPFTIAVVGANDGRSFTLNPCLTAQARWAGSRLQLYLNLNSPVGRDPMAAWGPAGHCGRTSYACMAYNYGYNDAERTLLAAAKRGATSKTWWIDAEMAGGCTMSFPTNGTGYWSCYKGLNSHTIQGALDAFRSLHVTAGVYGTGLQWDQITGGYVPHGGPLPTWVAGVEGSTGFAACRGRPIAGTHPWMVQIWAAGGFDIDMAC